MQQLLNSKADKLNVEMQASSAMQNVDRQVYALENLGKILKQIQLSILSYGLVR